MNTLLPRLIALACSFILAVPPGWCGGVPQRVAVEASEPVEVACCHVAVPGSATEGECPPCDTDRKCCCERDVAVPEKPVQRSDTSDVVAFAKGALAPDSAARAALGGTYVSAVLFGVRLHVLQCVWRC